MNDVWQNMANSGTELSCTANEVTTTVLGIDGPSYCKKGDIIVVNITTSIYFRASRYDFAIYTLTDNSGASDPIFGSECAVDVLGQEDNDFAPNNIQNVDGDGCYDVISRNGWILERYKFQDNLHVPCEGEPGKSKVKFDDIGSNFAYLISMLSFPFYFRHYYRNCASPKLFQLAY